jgi:5,10-methylenetetrahydrofolate reductase|tara:strand:- start:1195 stop:1368 length:174 start_codon:yes stop_codon:yes gene_type:complete
MELTGLTSYHLDTLRKMEVVKIYAVQGDKKRVEHRFYKHDLLKHCKLDEQGNYKEYE